MTLAKSFRAYARALGVVAAGIAVGCSGAAVEPKDNGSRARRPQNKTDACEAHCNNGEQDCGETGVDCGGEGCAACAPQSCDGHCENGVQDCEETDVDCGGSCAACDGDSDPTGPKDPTPGEPGSGEPEPGEPTPVSPGAYPIMRGVSLAGAEFGESNMPGTYGQTYIYPTTAEIDHWVNLGMNVFRLPFRWERLQRSVYAPFDTAELGRIETFVNHATDQGAYVILDPHNYARYYNQLIGGPVASAAFAAFWAELAEIFKDNPLVVFAIMNEPHTMSTELWLNVANEAIAAIRATGATNLIMVPGNAWSGAHSWLDNWYGTPNGTVMKNIDDPLENTMIEVHQYLDANSGGVNMSSCVSNTIGSQRLVAFTNWAKQHKVKAFLGEFGAGPHQTCLNAIDDMLDYMDQHPDVWRGWAYWAAGPWWGNSVGHIEPTNGVDKPQTAVLLQHLHD